MVKDWSGPYEVGGTRGWFQRFIDDEYIHAERQPNGTHSVMWSTKKDWAGFLSAALDHVPDEGTFGQAYWQRVGSDEESEGSTRDLLRLRKQDGLALSFLSADVAHDTYFWRRPFTKLVASQVLHAEGALMFPVEHEINEGRLLALILATGSPIVRRAVEADTSLFDRAVAAAS